MADACPKCGAALDPHHVCAGCGYYGPLTAGQRIEQLADRGSFHEADRHLWSGNPLHFSDGVSSYEKQVAEAQAETQLLDAVVTGHARVLGARVMLIVFDFRFLGGSMGSVVGEKAARAFDVARRERVPAVVVCSSGGARIQEGMIALFQMAKTSLAAARLREVGVPLLTVLADPTMGGVLASFASLGDVILAEPLARIAFVGPRVHATAIGDSASPGTAEFALQHGLIDAIVARDQLRPVLGYLAGALHAAPLGAHGKRESPEPPRNGKGRRDVWETVELARHAARPSGRALAHAVFSEIFELHGDRQGDDDDSVMAAIGRLGVRSVVIVAQDRHSLSLGRTRASGYRKAQRAYTLAERFRLPLITLVDTPGAATDAEAEAAGITGAIAESLARLARLRTPVVNVVVGEGGSGGALALSVGDRLLMQENAIFSVIGPEAASAILYHDAEHAQELATRLKLTAADLVELRLVDRILPEQPAGHEAPEQMATVLRQALLDEVGRIAGTPIGQLLKRREAKFRHVHELRGRLRLLIRYPPGPPHSARAARA
ncbi:MAG TPA: 50S ribosomal protein L32 [Candidatus Dormibacteraeota bacterium]|jgi:acetyl-CoA carboxylase carboxyl transferase subunit beta|nr:50S ribosomal protein L32 [Candidatus Dormibacteraeota bacterium]